MKKVVDVNPGYGKYLIEILDSKEILNTNLIVDEKTKTGMAPQAYILKIGGGLENFPYQVGDRIVMHGTYVPVPNCNNKRELGIIDQNVIKAVLVEE